MFFFIENGIVKNLIHNLKYKNQEQISGFLGDWYGEILKTDSGIAKIDFVIPVPLHKKKRRKRGYNQVDGFGKGIAHHLGAKFRDDLLLKTANTRTQTKKDRIFRWQNAQELYILNTVDILQNKNILLVDDVITTGATLEACSTALQQAKDVKIFIATMAVVPLF
ncbi:ComF family protein [Costertonia aggregata]|uniref:ComF family protein n=1 Tax=Costertonia aggregata TaxID=343403 RepID=UPI00293BF0DD|nr:ComF family protein [Costertonia aggregata]